MSDIIERSKDTQFIEEQDELESHSLSITDYGYLAIVYNMKSGKRLVEVTRITTDDLPPDTLLDPLPL
jgi:ABC-type thiamine transport system substrate-binding protein